MSPTSSVDRTFHALADSTRRDLLLLLTDGERSANDLATPFPATRSAVSQHLAILLSAGLVDRRREGRRQMYRLCPEPLAEVLTWVQVFEEFWTERLQRLGEYLDESVSAP